MVNRIDLYHPMCAEYNVRRALALDSQSEVLPTWIEGFHLGEGVFRIEHREVAFPGIEIAHFFTENLFSDRHVIPEGETHFSLSLYPHHPILSWMGYTDPIGNAIAVHRSQIEYTSGFPPGWHGLYICFNDELLANLDLLPEKFWENSQDPNQAVLTVHPIRFANFTRFMQQWFPTAECLYRRGLLTPQEAALLREKFLCQFRELLDHTFEQRGDRQIFKPTRRYWIFATVQAMIDSNLAKNFTNEELCQQCCISPRAMQYAFKEITGVGVQQYIRARKLNAVREELCGPSADPSTIYAIASAYGFSHMGRFSEQFYRCFGEYPSTLKKLHKSDIKMRKSMIS